MLRVLLVIAAAGLVAGCTMVRNMMPSHQEAEQRTRQLQVLQLNVMRFADEYHGRVVEVMQRFQAESQHPEERLAAQNWKLSQSESAYLIASGPNPLTNLVDMVVLATLSRMVLDDLWVSELYGVRARPVQEAHRALEARAWEIAKTVLSDSQTAQLLHVIEQWREKNPSVRAVASIHFIDFAKTIGQPLAGEEQRSGGLFAALGLDPLAGLDPAVQEIAQTRALAERSIFYLQRAPGLVNMQVDRITYEMAIMPETKQLLASIDRVSLAGSAADRLVTMLPDVLAREREALLSQLSTELVRQRDAVGSISRDMRDTLEAGTETLAALQGALDALDRISARYKSQPQEGGAVSPISGRPFDIRDYADVARELAVATRELNSLTDNLDGALPKVRSATQAVGEDLQRVVDHAFWQLITVLLLLIAGIPLAALGYRAAASRLSPDRARQFSTTERI